MIPTMTYFREALSAPSLHFQRLKQAEPLLCNGLPIVRCTYSAIETEIMVNGKRFLLFIPTHREYLQHIEDLEYIAQERRRGPLLANNVYYEELTMVDSRGNKHAFDIILQEFPSGVMLKDAVTRYRADDLRRAIEQMKERMDNLGFCHNNLKPSNVIICDSGVARPLRYWYAKWETYSDNNISQLLNFIDQNCLDPFDTKQPFMLAQDCEAEYKTTQPKYRGITRLRKGHRYGFVDSDGEKITDYLYTQASDFCEGRAIVTHHNKVGVINCNGKKVINASYRSIEFDIETGLFSATNDTHHNIINYNGKILKSTKLDEKE